MLALPARTSRLLGALAGAALTAAAVTGLLWAAVSGNPVVTEPWDEVRRLGKVVALVALGAGGTCGGWLFGADLLSRRLRAGPLRELLVALWLAIVPAALAGWAATRPGLWGGAPARVLRELTRGLLVPLPLAVAGSVGLLVTVTILASGRGRTRPTADPRSADAPPRAGAPQ